MQRENKPPYRVPSMAEIAAVPPNGYTVVSTFSGCGGSALGYKMAGFRVLWANEFIPAARETYRANAPETILDAHDIRNVAAQDILSATGLDVGELDLLDGSPPCASFSTAGKREAGWGKVKAYSDTKQRTDDLFFEYARILTGLQPRVFVAENVSGLVKGTAKGYFLEILAALKGAGYRVEARALDAQWLGVPQMRKRILFVGVRNDLDAMPAFPTPLPYRYSVRDALPHILRQGDNGGFGGGALRDATGPSPTIGTGPQTGNVRFPPALIETYRLGTSKERTPLDVPSPAVLTHGRLKTTSELSLVVEPESDMTGYAVGREWDTLQPGEQSSRYFQLTRAGLETPCGTITQRGGDPTVASVTHPTERRKFSIAELKRICAFPDDFILTGTYAQQWERLGRAVPPVMMYHLAATIRDRILRVLDQETSL